MAAPLLQLRGGLGGVDPSAVASAALTLSAINSAYISLAPEPACKAYGMASPTLMQEWIVENMGFLLVGLTLAGFKALAGDDAAQCTAYGLIPPLVGTVKGLLNGVAGKCGVPETGNYLNGGIMVASIVSLLGGFGDSALIMKGVAGWWLLNGVGMFLAADKVAGAYGLKEVDPKLNVLFKGFGGFLSNFGALVLGLASGLPPAKAIGLANVPSLLVQLDGNFVTKDSIEVLGLAAGPQYFWLLVGASVVAFTTL